MLNNVTKCAHMVTKDTLYKKICALAKIRHKPNTDGKIIVVPYVLKKFPDCKFITINIATVLLR